MIFALTKHVFNKRSIPYVQKITGRCYNVISATNLKVLRKYALTNDPCSLKIELLRVVEEDSSFSEVDNFPKIIAQICVNRRCTELTLAFEILGCLEGAKSKSMMLGLYEVLDKCVKCGHIDDAMKAYFKLRSINEKLDLSGKQSLLTVLAQNCRLCDIIVVLNDHFITDEDLVLVSEPLIMTGNMKIFTKLFEKYVSESIMTSCAKESDEVARVIRSVMYARMRRYSQLCEPSVEEKNAIKKTFQILQTYHSKFDTRDVFQWPSYFQLCQLIEIEKERMSPNEIAAYEVILTDDEFRAINRLPRFEVTNFPYIVEGDDLDHLELLDTKKIKDLSSEIKKKCPSRVLLYSSRIFPEAYSAEMRHLKEKNLAKFFNRLSLYDNTSYSLIGAKLDDTFLDDDSDSEDEDGYNSMETNYNSDDYEESDSDDSDDDLDNDSDTEHELLSLFNEYSKLEEEAFMRMNRTVRTLLPPSFKLNDITQTLERRKPSISLEFSEDIFDIVAEPTVWPHVIMPGGFILHRNEKKDPAVKN